ncbi:NYN domain-containing protein [Roseofilum reptotaenium CS-1145]|uniref:RNA-binding protein n=1 Tax=Roseofilum reptotaenium AO1-A TaxID=1925591 RepID=A0A1L9QUC4_9CYAN|nr:MULTISPECIES: NYN domain-containing protein [Roseofilum]MBP0031276.1 NYN domain-containing protein [Roseofilum sp. Guam]MDB9516562.1 NYN domain-containing protein [Roseofilum reptotaenium CS-1145]OJJ26271.1 RNA-binding protein [Roseofilum reptotaenium AO1-A]
MSRPRTTAILFVDGYNIIGAWSDLQATRDRQGLDVAREQLIEVLTNYGSFRGYDTRIVFDAHLKHTPSHQEKITNQVCVHYTNFGQTADSYIEIACAKFSRSIEKYQKRLIVATSDRAQQMTVVGYGAEWMSASRLAHDVSNSQKGLRDQRKTEKKVSRSSVFRGLDASAQKRLAAWRMGLPS